MKKQACALLVMLAAAVLLCAVWLLLPREGFAPAEEPSAPRDAQPTQTVLRDSASEAVRQVRTHGPQGGFTALRNSQGQLELPSLSGLPEDSEALSELSVYAGRIRGSRLQGAGSDLEDYGLDEASSTAVDIDYTDGTSLSLRIGGTVPAAANASRYVLLDSRIYIMYELHVTPFLRRELDYLSLHLTPSNRDSQFLIAYLSVGGAARQEPLTVTYAAMEELQQGYATATYELTSPRHLAMNYNDQGSAFLQSVFGMTATAAEMVHPGQEDLERYGLAEPYTEVEAVCMDQEGRAYAIQFITSEANPSGDAYLMMGGRDIIYRYPAAQDPWYSAELEDILGRQILVPAVKTVDTLTWRTAESTHTAELLWDDREQLSVRLSGTDYQADNFKKCYEVLISAELDSFLWDEDSLEGMTPVFTLIYSYRGGGSDTVAFYEGPVRQVYVARNGILYGLMRSSYLDTMLEALDDLVQGREITVRY